jgi:hypothetical protein
VPDSDQLSALDLVPDGVSDKDAPTAAAKVGGNPPALARHTLQK